MPLVNIENKLPGISGVMAQFTPTAKSLRSVAQTLLVDTNGTLTRWEKELIATYVSSRNGCEFCMKSHGHVAGKHYGMQFIWKFITKDIHALVGTQEREKLIPLMRIAEMVRTCEKSNHRMVEYSNEARDEGFTD